MEKRAYLQNFIFFLLFGVAAVAAGVWETSCVLFSLGAGVLGGAFFAAFRARLVLPVRILVGVVAGIVSVWSGFYAFSYMVMTTGYGEMTSPLGSVLVLAILILAGIVLFLLVRDKQVETGMLDDLTEPAQMTVLLSAVSFVAVFLTYGAGVHYIEAACACAASGYGLYGIGRTVCFAFRRSKENV